MESLGVDALLESAIIFHPPDILQFRVVRKPSRTTRQELCVEIPHEKCGPRQPCWQVVQSMPILLVVVKVDATTPDDVARWDAHLHQGIARAHPHCLTMERASDDKEMLSSMTLQEHGLFSTFGLPPAGLL